MVTKNKKVLLMFIDFLIALISGMLVFLKYELNPNIYKVENYIIILAVLFLPLCLLIAMLICKGYKYSISKARVSVFIRYILANILATLLYVLMDFVLGYKQIVTYKMGAIVMAGMLMLIIRVTYKVVYGDSNDVHEDNGTLEKNVSNDTILGMITEQIGNKVYIDSSIMDKYFKDKTVLITGAAGTIGSSVFRELTNYGVETIIGVDICENNLYDLEQTIQLMNKGVKTFFEVASIRDYEKMNKIYAKYRPNIVFHAAAHKHVSVMENNPEEAVKNNVFGTFNCAKLAGLYNVDKFILISTDKAHNPVSMMGATKKICEMIMKYMDKQNSNTKYAAVRFCNIIGSNASLIPLVQKQIQMGGPVIITHKDARRYFISIEDATKLLMKVAAMVSSNEIFVLDVGKSIGIKDLVYSIIRANNLRPNKDIEIVYTGLRDGERIQEELVPSGSKVFTDNIFTIPQVKLDYDKFYNKLGLLRVAARENDKDNIRRIVEEIVTTYKRPKKSLESILEKQVITNNIRTKEEFVDDEIII